MSWIIGLTNGEAVEADHIVINTKGVMLISSLVLACKAENGIEIDEPYYPISEVSSIIPRH